MNQTDATDNNMDKMAVNLVLVFIYRITKNNHDSLIQLNNRVIDTFKKYGVLKFEVFQLGRTDDMMGFTNIAKTILAAPNEEEVWLEIQSYRDHNHLQEVAQR
jgi:hypothetical protein